MHLTINSVRIAQCHNGRDRLIVVKFALFFFHVSTGSPFRLDDAAAARHVLDQLADVRTRAKAQKQQLHEQRTQLHEHAQSIRACQHAPLQPTASVDELLQRFSAWLPAGAAPAAPVVGQALRSIDELGASESVSASVADFRIARRSTALASPSAYLSTASTASSACPSPSVMPSTPRAMPAVLASLARNLFADAPDAARPRRTQTLRSATLSKVASASSAPTAAAAGSRAAASLPAMPAVAANAPPDDLFPSLASRADADADADDVRQADADVLFAADAENAAAADGAGALAAAADAAAASAAEFEMPPLDLELPTVLGDDEPNHDDRDQGGSTRMHHDSSSALGAAAAAALELDGGGVMMEDLDIDLL